MKMRTVAAVLLAALFALSGCAPQKQDFSAITVYYPYTNNVQNKSLTIGYETRTGGDSDTLKAAINALCGSPANSNLKAIFPDGVKILSYKIESGTLNLVMSDAYADMPLGEKAIARSCLALTLCGLSGVSNISISVGDIPDVKNLSAKDILTENTKLNPYEARIKLYFTDNTSLVAEYRDVTLAKDQPAAYYVMEELLKGPQGSGLSAAIPSGTTLLSLSVSGGICTVNLSSEFLNNKPNTEHSGTLAVFSIVNTLTAVSGISKVQILVNGEKVTSYLNVNIGVPVSGRDDLVTQ